MSRRRRLAALAVMIAGLPVAAAVVALVAAMGWGISVDASRWRDTIAQRASDALSRPVFLQGAVELTLGRELVLRTGGVRVMNPPGFSAQQFLAVGAASARIDVFDLLRGRWRLRRIEASDVVVWLERAVDGSGNWVLATGRDPARAPAALDIGQFTLHGLAIHYLDARSATRRVVDLDELSGSAGRNDRLRLAGRGWLDEQVPYVIALDGGPLQLLQQGSEPWPFTLDFSTREAGLHANGSVDAGSGTAGFGFSVHAQDLQDLGRRLGSKLPIGGAAALQGTAAVTAGAVELTSLRGSLGECELSGQLALAFGGTRPRLSGSLDVPALDLRPVLAADRRPQEKPTLDDDALPRQTPLSLHEALPVDIAVDLTIGRWLGLPLDVHDARFELRADQHGLRMPMHATLASVPFSGSLQLDMSASTPTLALQLVADNARLGELARDLAEGAAMEGTLGRIALRVDGRGDTLASLLNDLELSLAVARAQLRYGHGPGGRPIAFTLDTLDLAVRRGEPLRGQARGSLLGERAVLAIRAGTLADLLGERAMPLGLELALARATLRIEATHTQTGGAGQTALAFDLRARRSGDLARWLDVAPQSDLGVDLRGRLRIADDHWALERTTLKLGRSELTIDARRTLSSGQPGTMAVVRSPLIDVPELSTLRAGGRASAGALIDAPIFSASVEFEDADVQLDLQHVLLGRTEVVDLAGIARARGGRLLPSAVTGRLAGAPFTAQVELDLRGALPSASLDLSTADVDVGVLLRELGVAEDIDGRAGALQLRLQGRGNSLRELAEHSDIEARVAGGSITVRGAAQRAVAEIRVDEARIGAIAGEPIRLRLDGALDHTPLKLELSSGTLADFMHDATRLPFAMAAQAAGTRLTLEGEVALPLGREGQLVVEIGGERLDTLDPLARVALPPWGPWSLRGPIRMTPTGYELQGLLLAVGRSRLGGSGELELGGPRPRLQMQLAAPSIQLDDFPLPQRLADEPTLPARTDSLRDTASRLAGRTDTLLSAGFLRRLDASIDVKAKEVLSGADRLADGVLHLELEKGRLHLDPAVVNLPGGTLRLSISYDLKESELDFAVAARVERFDYGIIARRLGRGQDVRGLFSLDMALVGRAPSLDTIMRNADGKVDFAIWPTDLRSGVFNLWSVNMLLALLPLIDPGAKAQVNCIVGRFDLEHGRLRDDKIVIDTTALRIRGAGHADLATEELAFVFRPRAKGLALFRLQTPMRVSGSLTDQRFGFTQWDVVESALRLIASPILLPIERLTQGPLPRDGADVCTDPLRASGG